MVFQLPGRSESVKEEEVTIRNVGFQEEKDRGGSTVMDRGLEDSVFTFAI